MKNNFNAVSTANVQKDIFSTIKNIERELLQTNHSQHQESNREVTRPQAKASQNDRGDDRDSMLGSLLFDCFFGTALIEMLEDALDVPQPIRELDFGEVTEIYDEIQDEIQNDRANGKYNMGDNNTINGAFNCLSTFTANDNTGERQAMRRAMHDLESAWEQAAKEQDVPGTLAHRQNQHITPGYNRSSGPMLVR